MHKLEFRAMGTQMLVAVDDDAPEVGRQLEQVPGWFEEWEQTLSRFRADSELSMLNRADGVPVPVSPVLWELIELSFNAEKQSHGLISPALLPALEYAGYSRSFEFVAAGAAQNQENPIAETNLSLAVLEGETHTVTLPKGMRLDFGGVAKGWAAEKTKERLRHLGAVLVDAGGDIATHVPVDSEVGWEISIQDPLGGGTLEVINLCEGGTATSGRDRRHWLQGDRKQHHIIHPRTQRPAETDLLTVSIIANDAVSAEIAAKTVFILGSEEGFAWLGRQASLCGLGVLENGDLITSKDFEQFTRKKNGLGKD